MFEANPVAKRICPLFVVSPTAFDKLSSNCGSCMYYQIDYKPPVSNACTRHSDLINWIKNQQLTPGDII